MSLCVRLIVLFGLFSAGRELVSMHVLFDLVSFVLLPRRESLRCNEGVGRSTIAAAELFGYLGISLRATLFWSYPMTSGTWENDSFDIICIQ